MIGVTLKSAVLGPARVKACFQKAPLLPECERYCYLQECSGSCNNVEALNAIFILEKKIVCFVFSAEVKCMMVCSSKCGDVIKAV